MSARSTVLLAALGASALLAAFAAPQGRDRKQRTDEQPQGTFLTEVPARVGEVVLGRPTKSSVTLVPCSTAERELVLIWARDGEALPERGRSVKLAANEPQRVVLDGLAADTRYVYELRDPQTKQRVLPTDAPGAFRTARPAGAAFRFDVQADSHLDESCSLAMYDRTLANMRADAPDFVVDLGDTFMTEKHADRDSAARQYVAQHFHLGALASQAPLLLALGNHDAEGLDRRGQAPTDGLAAWSTSMRKRWFANPAPDDFYSGNGAQREGCGAAEDYYAFEWGDALLVVLDPYWASTPTRGGREPWAATLGKAQYDWLAKTLRGSKRAHKLVFVHQLTSGLDSAGRGGAEAAAYHEWGGLELDGTDGFAAHRPGWEKPIHALLVETGVELVFHGHDHFYARQERDGVVYQLVPQPAHRNLRSDQASEYGYAKGEFLPNSGYVRVSVDAEAVQVEYVRSALPENARQGLVNGAVAASYRVGAKQPAKDAPKDEPGARR